MCKSDCRDSRVIKTYCFDAANVVQYDQIVVANRSAIEIMEFTE